MKCTMCDGTGQEKVYDKLTNAYIFIKCAYCNGTGEMKVKQTNDEWRKTCSTEEFAEFLSKIEEQYPCGSLLKCNVTCGYHSQCRNDDVAPTNKEAWVEWLKQPHTD